MKTVVIQSFRTSDVPAYIPECLKSVEGWAKLSGYAYRFYDDAFLELAPTWYRRKAGTLICLVTDLARLIQARDLLLNGFDRVVWCDADIFVFRPELLCLHPGWSATYCKEVWLDRTEPDTLVSFQKVNNSMCVFAQPGLSHLEQYISRCFEVVQATSDTINDHCVGTDLLTAEQSSRAQIATVGMVSPMLMEAIIEDNVRILHQYTTWQGSPIYAANLCNAIRRSFGKFPKLFDQLSMNVVQRLRSGKPGDLLSATDRAGLATRPEHQSAVAET